MSFVNQSIGELWIELTRLCLTKGTRIPDDQGDILELTGIPFVITHPSEHDPLVGRYGVRERISTMIKNFTTEEPQFGYKFSYGSRIFGTPSSYEFLRSLLGKRPDTKTATISLIREGDFEKNHVPCIATLDFKIREGNLHVHYFCRSQDLFKKSYADNIAIFLILQKLAQALNVGTGSVHGYIASAHVYCKDLPEIYGLDPFHELLPVREA